MCRNRCGTTMETTFPHSHTPCITLVGSLDFTYPAPQIDPRNMDEFVFTPGVTPLASFRLLALTALAYVLCAQIGTLLMFRYKRFYLKGITTLHNAFLCIWSAYMCYGIAFYYIIPRVMTGDTPMNAFMAYSCGQPGTSVMTGRVGYLFYMYYLSKYYELLDTALIVLKKKPLILLHYYHHAIVLPLTYFWMIENLAFAATGLFLNTLVHVFMYYYYAVANMGYSPWWKRHLTSFQIVQFALNFVCSAILYYNLFTAAGVDYPCTGTISLTFSNLINITFLGLFMSFASRTYGSSSSKANKAMAKKAQ